MKRLVTLLFCVGLLVSTVVFAQKATPQEKAAAQAAFAQIDSALLVMGWSYGDPDKKPDLEKLSTLISQKGLKVTVRHILLKHPDNEVFIKEWKTEKVFALQKIQEAILFQIKYTEQCEANPEKTPPTSKDQLLIELNEYFVTYWHSRGFAGEEIKDSQRKSVNEWMWVQAYTSGVKIKTPITTRVKLVKEGKAWKLSEIQVNEINYQNG